MRAHVGKVIRDSDGTVITGASVRVLNARATTPVVGPLYASDTGNETLTNPFIASSGAISLYLPEPQRVRLGVTPPGGAEVFHEDIDVILPEDGVGTGTFTLSNQALGTHPLTGDFIWHSLPGFSRGLVWRFALSNTGTSNWGFKVTSGLSGTGEVMFEASGIGTTIYSCSWPWMFQTSQPGFYLGIRNIAGATADFVLTDLRAEVYA